MDAEALRTTFEKVQADISSKASMGMEVDEVVYEFIKVANIYKLIGALTGDRCPAISKHMRYVPLSRTPGVLNTPFIGSWRYENPLPVSAPPLDMPSLLNA